MRKMFKFLKFNCQLSTVNCQFAIVALCALLLVSCGPPAPTRMFALDANHLARRQMTTRQFDTSDERKILSASAQVIQDLGFTIDESETRLGLITASRKSEIGSPAQRAAVTGGVAALMVLGVMAGGQGNVQVQQPEFDVEQTMYLTLVTTQSRAGNGFNVRVEMSRTIRTNLNNTRSERIAHQPTFQDFFNRLGQSLFLEAHNI